MQTENEHSQHRDGAEESSRWSRAPYKLTLGAVGLIGVLYGVEKLTSSEGERVDALPAVVEPAGGEDDANIIGVEEQVERSLREPGQSGTDSDPSEEDQPQLQALVPKLLSGAEVVTGIFRIVDRHSPETIERSRTEREDLLWRLTYPVSSIDITLHPLELEALSLRPKDLRKRGALPVSVAVAELTLERAPEGLTSEALVEVFTLVNKRFNGDPSVYPDYNQDSSYSPEERMNEHSWAVWMKDILSANANNPAAPEMARLTLDTFDFWFSQAQILRDGGKQGSVPDGLEQTLEWYEGIVIEKTIALLPIIPLLRHLSPESTAGLVDKLTEMQSWPAAEDEYLAPSLEFYLRSVDYDGAPGAFVRDVLRPKIDEALATTAPGYLDQFLYDDSGAFVERENSYWRDMFREAGGAIMSTTGFLAAYCSLGIVSDQEALSAFPIDFEGELEWRVDRPEGKPRVSSYNVRDLYLPFVVKHGGEERVWRLFEIAPEARVREKVIGDIHEAGALSYYELTSHAHLLGSKAFGNLLGKLAFEDPNIFEQAARDNMLSVEKRVHAIKAGVEERRGDALKLVTHQSTEQDEKRREHLGEMANERLAASREFVELAFRDEHPLMRAFALLPIVRDINVGENEEQSQTAAYSTREIELRKIMVEQYSDPSGALAFIQLINALRTEEAHAYCMELSLRRESVELADEVSMALALVRTPDPSSEISHNTLDRNSREADEYAAVQLLLGGVRSGFIAIKNDLPEAVPPPKEQAAVTLTGTPRVNADGSPIMFRSASIAKGFWQKFEDALEGELEAFRTNLNELMDFESHQPKDLGESSGTDDGK